MTPTTQQRDALDVQELRRLAEAATPGPWRRGTFGGVYIDTEPNGYGVAQCSTKSGPMRNCNCNEAFIAAANPAAILALLDEREALKQRLAHAQMAADAEARDRDEWRERALRAEAAAGMSAPPVKS